MFFDSVSVDMILLASFSIFDFRLSSRAGAGFLLQGFAHASASMYGRAVGG